MFEVGVERDQHWYCSQELGENQRSKGWRMAIKFTRVFQTNFRHFERVRGAGIRRPDIPENDNEVLNLLIWSGIKLPLPVRNGAGKDEDDKIPFPEFISDYFIENLI